MDLTLSILISLDWSKIPFWKMAVTSEIVYQSENHHSHYYCLSTRARAFQGERMKSRMDMNFLHHDSVFQ